MQRHVVVARDWLLGTTVTSSWIIVLIGNCYWQQRRLVMGCCVQY